MEFRALSWQKWLPAGALVIAGAVVAGGAALYYLSLPAHPGPENSSPPPEALGLAAGAFVGCTIGVAAVAILQRSVLRAAASFVLGLVVSAGMWLTLGSGAFGDRAGDCLLGAVVLGVGALTGVAVGRLVLARRWR